jgi:hypothetical protein
MNPWEAGVLRNESVPVPLGVGRTGEADGAGSVQSLTTQTACVRRSIRTSIAPWLL